MDPNDTLL